MEKEDNSSGCSFNLCEVVFIVFLVLKLTGAITWSWWWVFAPLWIPVAVAAVVATLCTVIAIISSRNYSD